MWIDLNDEMPPLNEEDDCDETTIPVLLKGMYKNQIVYKVGYYAMTEEAWYDPFSCRLLEIKLDDRSIDYEPTHWMRIPR